VAFAEEDKGIEPITANRVDEALAKRVRLWTDDLGLHGDHIEAGKSDIEFSRAHGAVVGKAEGVGMAAGERFAELLPWPVGVGMRGDAGV
jgi:hypothetical protein